MTTAPTPGSASGCRSTRIGRRRPRGGDRGDRPVALGRRGPAAGQGRPGGRPRRGADLRGAGGGRCRDGLGAGADDRLSQVQPPTSGRHRVLRVRRVPRVRRRARSPSRRLRRAADGGPAAGADPARGATAGRVGGAASGRAGRARPGRPSAEPAPWSGFEPPASRAGRPAASTPCSPTRRTEPPPTQPVWVEPAPARATSPCRQCGTPNGPERFFCRHCGVSLTGAVDIGTTPPPRRVPWWRRLFRRGQGASRVDGRHDDGEPRARPGAGRDVGAHDAVPVGRGHGRARRPAGVPRSVARTGARQGSRAAGRRAATR